MERIKPSYTASSVPQGDHETKTTTIDFYQDKIIVNTNNTDDFYNVDYSNCKLNPKENSSFNLDVTFKKNSNYIFNISSKSKNDVQIFLFGHYQNLHTENFEELYKFLKDKIDSQTNNNPPDEQKTQLTSKEKLILLALSYFGNKGLQRYTFQRQPT